MMKDLRNAGEQRLDQGDGRIRGDEVTAFEPQISH